MANKNYINGRTKARTCVVATYLSHDTDCRDGFVNPVTNVTVSAKTGHVRTC